MDECDFYQLGNSAVLNGGHRPNINELFLEQPYVEALNGIGMKVKL